MIHISQSFDLFYPAYLSFFLKHHFPRSIFYESDFASSSYHDKNQSMSNVISFQYVVTGSISASEIIELGTIYIYTTFRGRIFYKINWALILKPALNKF